MKALTARVADGGRLVTRGTHQDVGFDNWVVKRDWRRDFDQEIVREGWELFRPNLNVPLGNQPFPQNQPTPPTTIEPINLQKMVRSANGRTAFIAGTPTTLYRYYAQDEGGYFEDELDENYFEAAELGGNLVTASTGNYTITGLTVGQKYRWIPGAGETELSDTSSGALYSFSGSSGFENFAVSVGLTFTARTTSVSVLGASGPAAGALHELIEEEYCDPGPDPSETVLGTDLTFISYMIDNRLTLWLNEILFHRRNPGSITSSISVQFDNSGLVVGNAANVTWDGSNLYIEINGGVTTRQTVETAIRAQAPEFLEEWAVYAGGYSVTGGGPYFESSGVGAPYFSEDTGTWRVIGSGFSKLGNRWQVAEIGDYAVFNNGYDLPVTYRLDENEVVPIYELREQGIAFCGSMGVIDEILKFGDVGVIDDDVFVDWFGHTDSAAITASQGGSDYSGNITAAQVGATNDVLTTGSVAFFDAGWVGRTIVFANGFTTTISAFVNSSRVTLTAAPTLVGATALIFWVIDLTTDFLVTASAPIFDASMVGKQIYWDTGEVRTITGFNSTTSVDVDSHQPVPSGFFQIENTGAYGAFTDTANTSRIQFRIIWGTPGQPRRWAAVVPGTINAGEYRLTLKFPSRSFEIGQEITITGAGLNGDNLHTTILYIAPNRRTLILEDAASVSVEEEVVQATDAIGSIVGADELTNDSSAIIGIGALNGMVVVYKDESIVFGHYTGVPEAPFQYGGPGRIVSTNQTPFYRHTLTQVTVDGVEMHFYAGRNAFYVLNGTTRKPQLLPVLEACKDIFYSQAKLENTNLIFAVDNVLTQELMIWFPSTSSEKGLAWDYKWNTPATLGWACTAAANIKRPTQGAIVGVAEDWFVMGDGAGRVLRYGKADVPQEAWGGAMEIYHRAGSAYNVALKSGLYGARHGEVQMSGYLVELSTQANPNSARLTVKFYGYRNAAENPRLLGQRTLTVAQARNLIPVAMLAHYFQDEITITVHNTPCRLASRTVDVQGLNSRSVMRRS
jgi:hypothetical protein